MDKIRIAEKLAGFSDHWSPRIVGELNGQYVKVAKGLGEMPWHHHEREDELFLVLKGRLTIRLRDGDVVLDEGECFIVPRGVEHAPLAEEECHFLLFEPKATEHTGNVQTDRTVAIEDQERI